MNNKDYLFALSILYLPIFCIRYFTIKLKFISFNIIKLDMLYIFIAMISITVVLLSYTLANGHEISFNLEDSYTRRFDGREIFKDGTVQAYLASIISNGFGPFLGFYGVYSKKNIYIIIAAFIFLSFFLILGIKSGLGYFILSLSLAFLLKQKIANKIPKYFNFLFVVLFLVFLVEYSQIGFSVTAEFFFRRIFNVPPDLVHKYLQVMANQNFWNPIEGNISKIKNPSYLVGYTFFTEEINANTNAFVYALAKGGIFSYVSLIFLSVCFFNLLDGFFHTKKSVLFIFLSFFFSLLITEQAFSTALFSSGYIIIACLLFITNFSKNRPVELNVYYNK